MEGKYHQGAVAMRSASSRTYGEDLRGFQEKGVFCWSRMERKEACEGIEREGDCHPAVKGLGLFVREKVKTGGDGGFNPAVRLPITPSRKIEKSKKPPPEKRTDKKEKKGKRKVRKTHREKRLMGRFREGAAGSHLQEIRLGRPREGSKQKKRGNQRQTKRNIPNKSRRDHKKVIRKKRFVWEERVEGKVKGVV